MEVADIVKVSGVEVVGERSRQKHLEMFSSEKALFLKAVIKQIKKLRLISKQSCQGRPGGSEECVCDGRGTYPCFGMAKPCYGTQHVPAALPATQIVKAVAVIHVFLKKLMDLVVV